MVLDTNLFIPAFAQPHTKVAQYQEVYPITSLDEAGSVEFSLESNTDKSVDLANSFSKVKCENVNQSRANLANADIVTLISFPIG